MVTAASIFSQRHLQSARKDVELRLLAAQQFTPFPSCYDCRPCVAVFPPACRTDSVVRGDVSTHTGGQLGFNGRSASAVLTETATLALGHACTQGRGASWSRTLESVRVEALPSDSSCVRTPGVRCVIRSAAPPSGLVQSISYLISPAPPPAHILS